jgi:hypothetical protein
MTGIPRTLFKEEVYVTYRRQALNILYRAIFLLSCNLPTNQKRFMVQLLTTMDQKDTLLH